MQKRFGIALLLIGLAFVLDEYVALAIASFRSPVLILFSQIVSNIALPVALLVPTIYLWKNKSKIPGMYVAVACAFMLSYLMKFIFRVERPESIVKLIKFTELQDYSFPSSHATIVFAPMHFLENSKNKAIAWSWAAFGMMVCLSRIYLGMHTLSDTIAGACLGYFAGMYFSQASKKLSKKDWLELRRQVFHLFAGLLILFLAAKNILNSYSCAAIVGVGIMISIAAQKRKLPLISKMLELFERPKVSFPGKGAILLVAGAAIALFVFPRDVAFASIAVLALGDSVSHIVGRFFGNIKHPFGHKMIEGTLAGMSAAFLGALLFVSLEEAILAATIAMLFEAIELKLHKTIIDDNLTIPLIAGLSILVLRLIL